MRPEQAQELAALAAKRGLMLCVIKQNRYNPAMRALKAAVDGGRFGTLVLGTVRVRWARDMSYYNGDAWRGKFVSDGGVITNQAIHHIDGLQWVMGPVEAVCAHGTARLNDIEVDDTTVAILRFANGASGVIEATTAARPADIEASLSVLGEGGSVVVGGWALNEIQFWKFAEPRTGDETAPRDFSQEIPTSYGFGHAPLLQEVIDRLKRGDTTPPVSAEEATRSLAIIHALYRSMEDGGWVTLGAESASRRLGVGPSA
jgi:predicted dehydrogenase